jgi:hypothetical protein
MDYLFQDAEGLPTDFHDQASSEAHVDTPTTCMSANIKIMEWHDEIGELMKRRR